MTTIVHDLERLHRQGYTLRQRAGGGWSGAWRSDLHPPAGGRPIASWESQPRKADGVATLARLLSDLDRPSPKPDPEDDPLASLAARLRARGVEVQRDRNVDAFIAEHPDLPIEDLLDALENRGLLDGGVSDEEPT